MVRLPLYWKAWEMTNLQKGAKNKRTIISNDTLFRFIYCFSNF